MAPAAVGAGTSLPCSGINQDNRLALTLSLPRSVLGWRDYTGAVGRARLWKPEATVDIAHAAIAEFSSLPPDSQFALHYS